MQALDNIPTFIATTFDVRGMHSHEQCGNLSWDMTWHMHPQQKKHFCEIIKQIDIKKTTIIHPNFCTTENMILWFLHGWSSDLVLGKNHSMIFPLYSVTFQKNIILISIYNKEAKPNKNTWWYTTILSLILLVCLNITCVIQVFLRHVSAKERVNITSVSRNYLCDWILLVWLWFPCSFRDTFQVVQ